MSNESVENDEPGPCMQCGKPTTRLVIVWEGPLCSEACEKEWEDSYWYAVASVYPGTPDTSANDYDPEIGF